MYAKYNHRLMGLVLLLFMIVAAETQAGGGIEWTNINNGLPNDIAISALAVDPDNSAVIYAVGAGGVYKTVDSGSNWTVITGDLLSASSDQGKNQGGQFTALAVGSSSIYLGYSGRIFKGTKDGGNWVDITGTMSMTSGEGLSIVLQDGDIYVGNNSGVYKSIDDGGSWTKQALPVGSCRVVSGTTTGNLYALANYAILCVTTDGGQNWGTVSSSLSFQNLLVYPDAMYVATWNGIFKSITNGVSWETITTGLPTNLQSVVCLAGDPGNSSILYAWVNTYPPNGMALYKTTDGGDTWAITTLSPSASANSILVTAGAVYTAGKGIHRSIDAGANWSIINTGLPHHVDINTIVADPKTSGTVYMTNWRGVFKSIDSGNSWQEKNKDLPITYSPSGGFSVLTIDPNNSSIIYAGKNQMFYKSIDGGDNWGSLTAKLIGLSQYGYVYVGSIVIDPNGSRTVYVSGDSGVIYKGTDAGTNWSKITIPQTGFAKLLIAPEDSNMLYGVPSYENNIYRSNNQGDTWTTMQVGSNWQISGIALGTTSSTMYAFGGKFRFYQYTALSRILKTTNNGGTWTQISDEKVNPLIVHPDITGVLYGLSDNETDNIITYSDFGIVATGVSVVKSIDDGKSWGQANQGLPNINTGNLISPMRGSVGQPVFVMDPLQHDRFYLNYPPYGIYRGTDTNTAPLPPTISTPSNGAKTSDATPLIVGNSSPGSVVFVYDGVTLSGTAAADSIGLFSLSCSNLSIAAHTLNAIAVDRFGTSGTVSLSLTIVVGVAPSIDSPISGATNQATITITGIAEDKAAVVIYDGFTPMATITAVNGFYSQVIKFDDGLHRLFAMSINNDGITATSNMVDLLIDTVAPRPPIITKPIHNSKTSIDKLIISGNTIGSSTVFIYLNSLEAGTCTSDADGNFSFTTPEVLDGVYEITARVKDTANNISPFSYPIKVTAGIPPIITSPVSGKTSKAGGITISGNCNSSADVQIYLDNINIATVTASSIGTFTHTIISLAEGTHTITVKSIKNNKTSGFSNKVTLIVAPDIPIDPIGVNISSPRGTEHPMSLDEDSKVGVYWHDVITISVPVSGSPTKVSVLYKGTSGTTEEHLMTASTTTVGVYEYSFKPYPLHGDIPMEVKIEYATGTPPFPISIGSLLIDPDGHVYNAVTSEKVTDAVVTCYYWSTATTTWEVWDAWNYPFNNVPQINPQTTTTGNDCYYSFMVPAGKYYIHAVCPGYKTYQSGVLEVIIDPIHHDVYMEPIPVLTSLKVCPQAVVLFPGGTYSFTTTSCRDQYDRSMPDAACDWSYGTGSFSPQTNSSAASFTAPMATGTYIITAATASVSGTASVIVREPVSIRLSSASNYARRGDVFTMDVVAETVVDLTAAKVVVLFDKTRLRAGTVSKGSFFNSGDTVSLQKNIRNDLGSVEISGARVVSSGSFGVTGSGTIYSVSFTAIADDPRGTITITDVVLKDAALAIICPKTISPLGICYRFLGDFGKGTTTTPDGVINLDDLMWFSTFWNTKDMRGDIASTRTTGYAPWFTPEPDGMVEFEDLTRFSAMWYWYHNLGTSSFAPLMAAADRDKPCPYTCTDPNPTVRLESALEQDKVLVDIVVENVDNLLSGHFVVRYDADRLEVGSVNATFCRKDQPGILDINVAGLGSLLQSGTISQIAFKKKASDSRMPAVIYLQSADLRMYQNGAVVPVFSPQKKQLTLPTDLSEVRCYPNPFVAVAGRGIQQVTFSPVTKMAQLRIYNIAGELVHDSEMHDTSADSFKLIWDVENDSGENVASGIYLYLITNPDGQTKTGKIGVVR
ncbi:hypothetical protein KKE26_12735 [bacterium]|nr:hypothetical protein [bacterium]